MGTSAVNNSNETLRLIGLARAGDRQALSALLERHRDRLRRMVELRLVVGQRLATVHRHHLGTQMRDAGREVALYRDALPAASSAALAGQLLGRQTSPSQAAVRAERVIRLQEALNTLDPVDREVLALRHFEQLTAAETARVLGISEAAAAKRYIRALKRLKQILAQMPGGLEGL